MAELGSGAVRVGLGDVVRVGRVADARRHRVHAGAAAGGVLGRLQHHHARALAEHEAVPALVERPRRPLRLVVAGGQGPHRRERGDVQLQDRGLGAARHHDVGSSGPDHFHAVADRLGAGGTRADGRVHPGTGAELKPDPARRAVRHEHRDSERREPLPALLAQRVVGGQGGGHAAYARWRRPRRADPDRPAGYRRPPRPRAPRPARTARTGPAGAPARGPAASPGRLLPTPRSAPGARSPIPAVSFCTPLRPASSDSQVEATSAPTGVIAPRPVTTTRAESVPTVLPFLGSVPRLAGWPSAARLGCLDRGQADTAARRT